MFFGGRTSYEELYRELLSVKEAKADIERSRDEVISRNRELELKYQDLLLELKQLSVADTNKVAELECQLKVKSYELERCSVLLSESEAKFKHGRLENEKLTKKVEVLRDELSKEQTNSAQLICALRLQLQDKKSKLDSYEKLETELDKIIMRTASMPDTEAAEKILETYEKEAIIPLHSKRRLQQSLSLARRVLELENHAAELKDDLFKERDLKQELQQELTGAKACLVNLGSPASELIDIILKRDLEILKLKAKITALEKELLRLRAEGQELRKDLAQLSTHGQDLEVIKEMIGDLRIAQERKRRTSSKESRKARDKSSVHWESSSDHLSPRSTAQSFVISPSKLIHIKKPLSFSKLSQSSLEKKFKVIDLQR